MVSSRAKRQNVFGQHDDQRPAITVVDVIAMSSFVMELSLSDNVGHLHMTDRQAVRQTGGQGNRAWLTAAEFVYGVWEPHFGPLESPATT